VAGIEQFYAEQMFLLDSGQVEEWAQTFTVDGEFASNATPAPAVGREVIAAVAGKAAAQYAEQGVQRRHWLGMVAAEPRGADEAFVRSYALVIETPRGGRAAIRASTLCEDLMVRQDGRWLVRRRKVSRDDLL
jgi:hypothetical protein